MLNNFFQQRNVYLFQSFPVSNSVQVLMKLLINERKQVRALINVQLIKTNLRNTEKNILSHIISASD